MVLMKKKVIDEEEEDDDGCLMFIVFDEETIAKLMRCYVRYYGSLVMFVVLCRKKNVGLFLTSPAEEG
jgi:hypothetical protein